MKNEDALLRYTLRLGYNALRAQQRRQHYEDLSGRQELLEMAPLDTENQVEQAEKRQQVRCALARMKPRSAQILVLRHSGSSYADIAAALKISSGSVGTLLARAEAEFQRHFEEVERGE